MAAEMNRAATGVMAAREEPRDATARSRAPAAPVRPPTPAEHARETADSIVVAFILAFVFRAFVIEAFVIPTGSMAATLYGRHGTMICRDCGWEFAYGLTDPSSQEEGGRYRSQPEYGPNEIAVCPNCNHRNSTTEINDVRRNSEAGDRILALKWPYDVGGDWLGPKRWDVALFKDPSDVKLTDGVTNFIKRLVGLPDEVLEIIDGDVYTVPADQLSDATRKAIDDARHAKYLRQQVVSRENEAMDPRRSQAERAELRSEAAKLGETAKEIEQRLLGVWDDVLQELSTKLRICRKSPLAQEALWNVVYNHDFPPRELDSDQPYWGCFEGSKGWDVSGRTLRFDPRSGNLEGISLVNRPAMDLNGYNLRMNGEPCGVTDLRLKMVMLPRDGNGAALLKLPKRERSFWAKIDSDGTVKLFQTAGQPPALEKPLASAKLSPLAAGTAVTVDFQNVDYRVSLSIDGRECLATSPEQFAPIVGLLRSQQPEADPGEVQILAQGMALELNHVVVERDVFYRSPRRNLGFMAPLSTLTGTVWGGTSNPIWLRQDEFYMLGDNSAASGDSRLWSVVGDHLKDRGEACQLGTVPRDQLIGRAFFVYWPSGHRSDIIPLLDRIGMVPDVGRMRWIR